MADGDRLTLRQALSEDRLQEFVAQAEARDYETGGSERLDRVIGAGAPTAAPAARRTSGSPSRGGSSGSRTRRGRAATSHG